MGNIEVSQILIILGTLLGCAFYSGVEIAFLTSNKLKIELDKKQKKALAKKALTTRFNKDQIKSFKIDLDKLIDPVRKEDSGDDLWSVFNVIQEKIIDGDFEYKIGTKIRKARQIKNFKQDLKVNKELFEMATELIPN